MSILSPVSNPSFAQQVIPEIRLTPREREVLARVASGMTSKQIASALGVSLRTINTHREHLAKKLSTSSVATMVRYAIEHGITAD